MKYITARQVGKFIHFKEVSFDIFLLLDQDQDNFLRKYTVYPDLTRDIGDVD